MTQMDLAVAVRAALADLGAKTGPRSVSLWEAGRVPSCDELSAALGILGVPYETVSRERTILLGGSA